MDESRAYAETLRKGIGRPYAWADAVHPGTDMSRREAFDRIDVHLVRVLHTLIAERNVSRTALRLGSSQPLVSAQLKRLRELTGDPILVRTGSGMAPTAEALRMDEHARHILQAADALFSPKLRGEGFSPSSSDALFRVAASDYLDPRFIPGVAARVRRLAPGVRLEFLALADGYDYAAALAEGSADLVIGNWLKPPGELHLGRLIADEMVCLVAKDHPFVKLSTTRQWTVERYLAADHVAPARFHVASEGVVDDHLATLGHTRRLAVRCAHFGLIPAIVARSRLVLTTGRLYCQQQVEQLPVRIIRCPVPFPPLRYFQLWHPRSRVSPALAWFRDQVREVARSLVERDREGDE